jgi:UDP-N-acetylglucosamine--N-acetylmuramyl-(pentapeptide) pyrophosphoryl-undecaprenol N-acetylglucosamine transferase
MAQPRILISAGGTGGHLYPAQALAQQLKKQAPDSDTLFVAAGLKTNRYFDRLAHAYMEIASQPLLSRNPIKCLKGAFHLLKGYGQSVAIMQTYRPDLVVAFGSFYTVPTLLAAKTLRIPIILHEANSIPGKANRWLAPLADCVGIHFPSTSAFFKGQTVEVGLPLREGYRLHAVSRESALNYYGLNSQRKTLLIFGGSQGAKAINACVGACMPRLKELDLQIIHFTGHAQNAEELAQLYGRHAVPACVKPFEDQMQMAWSAADAFLGRGGASSVAESMEFEVPGIIIPYPYATDKHQEKNADFLVETVQAGWKLLEEELSAEKLSQTLRRFFEEQKDLSFKEAIQRYKQRPNQLDLCQLVLKMCNYKSQRGSHE